MTSLTKIIATGALAVGLSTGMAMAVPVMTLLGISPQGNDNKAGIDFAVGYGAYTPVGASWDVDPYVAGGNEPGHLQSPFNSNGLTADNSYFGVGGVSGDDGAPSPVTLSFSTVQQSFNLLWGSIDSYNTLTFYNGADEIASYNGDDVVAALGLPGAAVNYEDVALINWTGFDNGFDGVKFSSTQAAFEFALAPIPLPAAGLMLIGALGGLTALRRRRKSA